MSSPHETAIQLLSDQRQYWLSHIDKCENKIAAAKENLILLREEKESAGKKVSEFDQSIEALKLSEWQSRKNLSP